MNRRRIFGLLTILAIVGGGILFSFALEENEQVYRKIEVIHSSGGETVTYDTLVPENSDFDAEEYLAELGLENSAHLSIVRISSDLKKVDFSAFTEENGKVERENVVIRKDKNISIDHSSDSIRKHLEIDIDEIQKEIDKALKGLSEEQVVVMKRMGEMGEEIYKMLGEMEFSFDSLEIHEFNVDTSFTLDDGDDHIFFKMMCSDSVDFDLDSIIKGHRFTNDLSNFKVDIDVNCDDLTEKSYRSHGDFRMEVCTSGDEEFTVVLVTEGVKKTKKPADVDREELKNSLKVFPNPAGDYTTLQLDLKKKKPTRITISDVRGNVIRTFDLGKFKGKYREKIDVSDWPSGLYLVQLSHGDYSKIEKFVKE